MSPSSVLSTRFFARLPAALLLVVAAGTLIGCSGTNESTAPGPLPSAFPTHTADQIRSAIREPADTIQRYAAKARITVRTPSQNRSFNADVRHERGDSLFMRFSLFGMEGGRLLLTPDSVFFYDTRNRSLRVGPLADARKLLPTPVESESLFANLLGLIAPSRSTDWTVEADSSLYYLSGPEDRQTWTVDPSRWRAVRFKETDTDGSVLEMRHFSDFRTVGTTLIAHQLRFTRPSENLRARINYETIRLNPSRLSFELGAPSGVPRKPIQ